MATERGKLYQDRIYGTKVLSPLAVEIVNSAEVQRLAGLHQLGFTDLVFRGATHTRFEHSVGTYFMCRTMMRRIVQNHDRLGYGHPGRELGEAFALTPEDWLPAKAAEAIKEERIPASYQARWRGLTEVISAAGLIHDIGHVPFGHTLEDEFTGIYEKHDRLGGPRVYDMLFDESSELALVFSDKHKPWLAGITNDELRALIYLILNWKEEIEPLTSFQKLLETALEDAKDGSQRKRLQHLKDLHRDLSARNMFHPFMSDIVGNTICADLLDYLPRDRMNLGMEVRRHARLQRYFTIRPGSLYPPEEGLRLSILVTRKGRGGQRRDVATTVLDIMRERYQMAERVFYHHKKAAASAMLAKLTELAGDAKKPRGEDGIYPAPWNEKPTNGSSPPHMVHLSDSDLINYLGRAEVNESDRPLQRKLFQALRYRRKGIYRTLLVIDSDLAHSSPGEIGSFARRFRDNKGKDRRELEGKLAEAANSRHGEVLIYCPSPKMQSKEVDARVEIQEKRVLPLRLQRESFAYRADLDVLQQYYREIWCSYIFVSPEIYDDSAKCRAIVDVLCTEFNMATEVAYKKVRRHEFQSTPEQNSKHALECAGKFIGGLPFSDLMPDQLEAFLAGACSDDVFIGFLTSRTPVEHRLTAQFEVFALRDAAKTLNGQKRDLVERRCAELLNGDGVLPQAISQPTFDAYKKHLVQTVLTADGTTAIAAASETRKAPAAQGATAETHFRQRILAIGPNLKQPKVRDEWPESVSAIVKYLESLPESERDDDISFLEATLPDQSELVAANIKGDQVVRTLKQRRKKGASDSGPLFKK